MNEHIDLNLVPFRNRARRDTPESMSIHISSPARGCARGRSADHLALCMTMVGNSILSTGKQYQALEHLAKLYYKTPGSATTAMRAVVNELNSLLMKRNQHISGTGKQGTALLAQLVLRGHQLYLAISGPMHLFIINDSESRHIFESEMAGRSVGQIRFPHLWLKQVTIHPKDVLILAAPPVPDWDEGALREARGKDPEMAIDRLYPDQAVDQNALLIQATTGKGVFQLVQPIATPGRTQKPIQTTKVVLTPKKGGTIEPISINSQFPEQAEDSIALGAGVEQPKSVAAGLIPEVKAEIEAPTDEGEALTEPTQPARPAHQANKTLLPGLSRTIASTGRAVGAFVKSLTVSLKNVNAKMKARMKRVLPEELFTGIPSSAMIFIAIAIPVIVVAVASQVYFSMGHKARNQALYEQALQQAEEAEKQSDLLAKKAGWEIVLDTLASVDESPDVQLLRLRGVNALDSLQLVERIDYRQALEKNLPAEILVTRLEISGEDLYLLDGNSGNVIRAYETNSGYVVDTAFICGPSVQGVTVSGPLIDMVAWPAGFQPAAEVLAVDSSWNILLCRKNSEPRIFKLAAPTNAVIGNLTGIALDMDDLYVLDPTSNAVWIYWNNQMVNMPEEEPYPFFTDEIPVLSDVIDLMVNNGEIHLLHSGSQMTLCLYSGIKEIPTRCSDPTFLDFRPGYENTPLVPMPKFSQLLYTPPPEPSLYFMESGSSAIYKFSVRSLGFQRKFLPLGEPVNATATAFTIDHIRRKVFLAIGNQVFSALMP